MKRIRVLVLVLALATLACGMPVVTPIAPTPNVTQETIVLPGADVGGLESVTIDSHIDICTIVAITQTNIRECGNVSCSVVGTIEAGQTVVGICSGEWVTLGKDQFVCIAALIGTGGCE